MIKYDEEITCSNVGIKAGSWQCDFCVLKNKCGALKIVKSGYKYSSSSIKTNRMSKKKMKVIDLIKQLKPYKDFDIEARVHLEVMEEELQKRKYPYPHDTYSAKLSVDDIGHSDKIVLIGVEITDN